MRGFAVRAPSTERTGRPRAERLNVELLDDELNYFLSVRMEAKVKIEQIIMTINKSIIYLDKSKTLFFFRAREMGGG